MNIVAVCITVVICVAVVAIFGAAAQVIINRDSALNKEEIEDLRNEFEDLKLNVDERIVSQQLNVQSLEKSVENLARKII